VWRDVRLMKFEKGVICEWMDRCDTSIYLAMHFLPTNAKLQLQLVTSETMIRGDPYNHHGVRYDGQALSPAKPQSKERFLNGWGGWDFHVAIRLTF
jgi:hypothetical protein